MINLYDKKNRDTERYRDELGSLLREYVYFYYHNDLSDNLADNLLEVRKNMRDRVVLDPLPYLEYKRNLWQELSVDYDMGSVEMTDDILENNRLPSGEKLTKYISKASREINPHITDARIDYFHKVRNEQNQYVISGDPLELLELYAGNYAPTTCASPGHENQSMMFRYLFSDQVYIAFTTDLSTRVVIYDNPEHKVAYINSLYGARDPMLIQVIIKYYIGLGYKFLKDYNTFFNTIDWTYIDSSNDQHHGMIKIMGGDFAFNSFIDERILLNRIPSHWNKTTDAMFDKKLIHDSIIWPHFIDDGASILHEGERWCSGCGYVVDESDFNTDYDYCNECAAEYQRQCQSCGEHFYFEDVNNEGFCQNCEINMEYYSCDACGDYVAEVYFNTASYLCDDCDLRGKELEKS